MKYFISSVHALLNPIVFRNVCMCLSLALKPVGFKNGFINAPCIQWNITIAQSFHDMQESACVLGFSNHPPYQLHFWNGLRRSLWYMVWDYSMLQGKKISNSTACILHRCCMLVWPACEGGTELACTVITRASALIPMLTFMHAVRDELTWKQLQK